MDTQKIKNISMIIGSLSLLMIAISLTISAISTKAVNDIVVEEYLKEQDRISKRSPENRASIDSLKEIPAQKEEEEKGASPNDLK